MKIVIIGAGISGLTTYLFLKKHLSNPAPPAKPHEIVIYETHDASRRLERQLHSRGATEQTANTIAIGGALGLGQNGLNVLKRLDMDLFHDVVRAGHSIIKWRMSCARGWELASVGVQTEDDPPMNSVMIGRQTLWRCIREYVPDDAIIKQKISQVVATEGQRPVLSPADGRADVECDLVLGCDGLRSIVRMAIFSDSTVGYPPHYE
jgi:2-polyprenyl-6-methoxyphenol hydroxylase-like FAD-dependent oxidoreductase